MNKYNSGNVNIVAFKYRLCPNEEQKKAFSQFFGCSRLLYNDLLAWWKTEYQNAKDEERKMAATPLVTFFKAQHPFFKDVDSLALMNARRHFMTAMDNFLSSKKGERPQMGFPAFKKRGCSDAYTTNNQGGTISVRGDRVKLPKIGYVRLRLHRKLGKGRIISATISRSRSGKYFISISVDMPEVTVQKRETRLQRVVGLDMSLQHFVVSSDKQDEARAKFVRVYREHEGKLAKLSRQVSRKKAGSNNHTKAKARLAKASEHVANIRHDFVVKTALHFAREYDVIVLESLNMQEMSQSLRLGKSVMDLGFGEFKHWIEWQCKKHGSTVVYADKWFASSKTCNCCGEKYEGLQLSDRQWVCPHCGATLDRDYNAACNLRDWYYRNIIGVERPESTLAESALRSTKQEAHKSLVCG